MITFSEGAEVGKTAHIPNEPVRWFGIKPGSKPCRTGINKVTPNIPLQKVGCHSNKAISSVVFL